MKSAKNRIPLYKSHTASKKMLDRQNPQFLLSPSPARVKKILPIHQAMRLVSILAIGFDSFLDGWLSGGCSKLAALEPGFGERCL